MTIRDAVGQTDSVIHNTYSTSEKVRWLSQLDWMVKKDIFESFTDGDGALFCGYDSKTDMDTELLVDQPHDEMYLRWLEAQIDYANGELEKYNNAVSMFQAVYDGFRNWYARTHSPKRTSIRFF